MNTDLDVTTNSNESALAQAELGKKIQEVQASMVIARKFPRNQNQCYLNVMEACKLKELAEEGFYTYAKGGTNITGLSIRMAEVLAQSWGNIDFGIRELSNSMGADGVGVSEVETYCWDMETNTRSTKIFQVKHWRTTRAGGYKLTDEREVYELVANKGSRRLRANILSVIPKHIQTAASKQINKTLEGDTDQPIEERVRNMLGKFMEFSVSEDMIEERMGHKISAITIEGLTTLMGIYRSLKDGMSTREKFFNVPGNDTVQSASTSELEKKLKAADKPKPKAEAKKATPKKATPKKEAENPPEAPAPEAGTATQAQIGMLLNYMASGATTEGMDDKTKSEWDGFTMLGKSKWSFVDAEGWINYFSKK